MGAGWAINLAVAEWIIRGRPTHPTRISATAGPRLVRQGGGSYAEVT